MNKDMKKHKAITVEDLILKKVSRKEHSSQTKDIYIEGLNGVLTFRCPTDAEIMQLTASIHDKENEEDNLRGMIEKYINIIYNTCDLFKSEKLIESLKGESPEQIVRQMFNNHEILGLGNKLIDFYYEGGKIDIEDKLKN